MRFISQMQPLFFDFFKFFILFFRPAFPFSALTFLYSGGVHPCLPQTVVHSPTCFISGHLFHAPVRFIVRFGFPLPVSLLSLSAAMDLNFFPRSNCISSRSAADPLLMTLFYPYSGFPGKYINRKKLVQIPLCLPFSGGLYNDAGVKR